MLDDGHRGVHLASWTTSRKCHPMNASLIELVRFGYGPRGSDPVVPGGLDPDRVLSQLDTDDPGRVRFARPGLAERLALLDAARAERAARMAGGAPGNAAGLALKQLARDDLLAWVPEAAAARCGFRERLVNFWSNRLTVATGRGELVYFAASFRDDVVRPHVGGRFVDMLKASVWHPAMLNYLDQVRSVGPASRMGQRKGRGLNENFARELLELHSMGSGYTQADVTELARLLAGMLTAPQGGTFDPERAEPGSKLILGETFGSGAEEINRCVEMIALRPETAESVARALARHFLSDTPPEALVERMATAYRVNGSALRPVYEVLLADPAAADPTLRKVRSPHEFVVASLRALDLTGAETTPSGPLKRGFRAEAALQAMGQPVLRPRGPDGWPDTAAEWISPPWLAARLDWAERLARIAAERVDPVPLAEHVLGTLGHPDTLRAAGQAEQRWEGVAVLFSAPDFMRR